MKDFYLQTTFIGIFLKVKFCIEQFFKWLCEDSFLLLFLCSLNNNLGWYKITVHQGQ